MGRLTSRERVLAAIRHEEPDMIPIDCAATRSSTGISAIVYNQLVNYLGFPEKARVFDVKQLLAEPSEKVRQYFESDTIGLHRLRPSLGLAINSWKESKLMDGSPCEVPAEFNPVILEDGSEGIQNSEGIIVAVRPPGGYYFDEIYNPLKEAKNFEDIDKYTFDLYNPWKKVEKSEDTNKYNFSLLSREEEKYLKERAKWLYENTEYAIVATTGISIFEKALKDFGYEEFLIKIYTERELVLYYLEKLTEAYINFLDRYIDAVGKYVQIIAFHDDFGTQSNAIIRPDIYREVFKPYHQRLFRFVKEKNPNLYIFFHSCGSIYGLIPDFIEAGVEILNPVQIDAANMEPAKLKREFGKYITFWGGGCSSQTTLASGTVEDVEREVKEMIKIFGPGGGFVFAQVHNIQPGVTPEKVIALYSTVKRYRNYPLKLK